mgnify:CR=1 FL=1
MMKSDATPAADSNALRFMPEIESAFEAYSASLPLDLAGASPQDIDSWRKHNRFSRITFARLAETLMSAEKLDDFVKKSSADFDNLGPVLDVAMRLKLISIDSNGRIERILQAVENSAPRRESRQVLIEPLSEYNQFPCDAASRSRRVELIKERYPNVERLRIGFIGDDDLVSAELSKEKWAHVVVVEKDPRIVEMLKGVERAPHVIESDVRDVHDELTSIDTFMTDPPYTLHGAASFITAGLKLLPKNQEEKEFYVILNPTMMGRHFDTLNRMLCASGVFLREVRANFSHYELPENFAEKDRSASLLRQHSIDPQALKYSSSSSLHIFSTVEPDVPKLESSIDSSLIYNHYV